MPPLLFPERGTGVTRHSVSGLLGRPSALKPVDRAPRDRITAGKNTSVYDAHTYHTKVPPEGIEQLIRHFTEKDAVVLDPFCGSGMTGVAALRAGRRAILSDLSPAAVFIARNLCCPVDVHDYRKAIDAISQHLEALEARLYGTTCRRCRQDVPLNYAVWSSRVGCPSCKHVFPIWETARAEKPSVRESKILRDFPCPQCGHLMLGRSARRLGREVVQVGYTCCESGRMEQKVEPSREDLARAGASPEMIPEGLWYPKSPLPVGDNTRQPIGHGIDRVDRIYTPRGLYAMAALWAEAERIERPELCEQVKFTLTSLYQRVTVFSEFRFWGGSSNAAHYNVPKIFNEQNVFAAFRRKARTIELYLRDPGFATGEIALGVASATDLHDVPTGSVDYVFTDPPFVGYINYSEMNFIWEAWLQDFMVTAEEAIINRSQHKGLQEYGSLMTRAMGELHRVLKEGAWATIVFHNSSNRVWNALREAIGQSGLRIMEVQVFDKTHGTSKMFTSQNATGHDLLVHCKKTEDVAPTEQEQDQDVRSFILSKLSDLPEYTQTYLHVDRAAEIDRRRMYSE